VRRPVKRARGASIVVGGNAGGSVEAGECVDRLLLLARVAQLE